MMAPRPEYYAPANAADLVADALAEILEGVPEIRDFFEILPRWDDAPRKGAFCAVTAEEGEGVADESGSVVAPVVDFSVSLCAAQGETAESAGFHAARSALFRLLGDCGALRAALLARIAAADAAVSAQPAEEGGDGSRYAAIAAGSIFFANQPAIPAP